MGAATKNFIDTYVKNDPKYRDFPTSMEEVIKKASERRNKALVISPHWFLPFGPEEYVPTIQKELNWQYPQMSYPGRSTNCNLNFISVYNSMKDYGYTHYHVEMSKLIRQGVISRDEALKDLEFKMSKSELNKIATILNHKYE
jgi:hypothetical protein